MEDFEGSVPYARGSETSREAADSVEPYAGAWRGKVLDLIRRSAAQGATCDEVEQRLNLRHQTASARIWELRRLGWIQDGGVRRLTRANRRAVVWVESPREIT